MSDREPIFEKSRRVDDVQHLRLMTLLDELVRDKGVMRAARDLKVDRRTLNAALETRRLLRRMQGTLEKALLEGGGSPAAEQRRRSDALEERVKEVEGAVRDMGGELNRGLAAVGDEVKTLKGWVERLELRQVLREGDDGNQESQSAPPGNTTALVSRYTPRREFPELATLEPAADDEAVFGDAWPLIQEWRGLRENHPNRGKGLEWLQDEEHLMLVELALLEEHGLTLPPQDYPPQGPGPQQPDQLAPHHPGGHPAGTGQGPTAPPGAAGAHLQARAAVIATGLECRYSTFVEDY
ncbi:MAG: hypothetical protein F4W95_05095 [Chloroflexi bacterium]|nr:hypothetical protein [Chloroflexota bacterium]MYD47845.1 hypothetical protein [Chloroflexota bacterium]